MLGQVREHMEAFCDGLLEFGRDKVSCAKVEVEFVDGTTLAFTRDDYAEFFFDDEEDDDMGDDD